MSRYAIDKEDCIDGWRDSYTEHYRSITVNIEGKNFIEETGIEITFRITGGTFVPARLCNRIDFLSARRSSYRCVLFGQRSYFAELTFR